MPSNTTYAPVRLDDLENDKLSLSAQGVCMTVTAGTTQQIDCTLANDVIITGITIIVNGGNNSDYAGLQVIDTTGAFSGTAGTVLKTLVTNWYMPPNGVIIYTMPFPAKILATMALRALYTSTGSTAVFVAANYSTHTVLI